MDPKTKRRLLKSLPLLSRIPEKKLPVLEKFLKPLLLEAETTIFREGEKGDSLYFITSGHVRISKKVSGKMSKELAVLGPGDCFGEMAILDEAPRSATAAAASPVVVFELTRPDLGKWLKSSPHSVLGFFTELVQVQSQRLRRTSSELTVIYDLSQLCLSQDLGDRELMARALEHLVPHLEGQWSAAAYLYNAFNDEMDHVASVGPESFLKTDKVRAPEEAKNAWVDSSTFHLFLPEGERPMGHLVFRSKESLPPQERTDKSRTLGTVARLLTTALKNAAYRSEETLRQRIKEAHAAREL